MKFYSIAANAMRNKVGSALIITLPLFFMLFNISGVFIWKCPFFNFTGVECGGCGMTRGVIAALMGNFQESFSLHPFALPMLLVWIGYITVQILPKNRRLKVIEQVESFEQITGAVYILVALFAIFGIVRLIIQVFS